MQKCKTARRKQRRRFRNAGKNEIIGDDYKMSSNKKVREELERLFGKECFIDKLHLRTGKKERYKSKGQMKRMQQLTYHHIKPKSKGGKATIENGALLSAENHEWFHKQSQQKQDEMNKAFQDYKMGVAVLHNAEIKQVQEIKFEKDEDYIVIPLKTTKQRRAKEKRELRKEIEEYGFR